MAMVPAFAKVFAGRWRIVEMDVGDSDVLAIGEADHVAFEGPADRESTVVKVEGFLDDRHGAPDGTACADVSWQCTDDGDEACGRGCVTLETAGRLVGYVVLHLAGDSGFAFERD